MSTGTDLGRRPATVDGQELSGGSPLTVCAACDLEPGALIWPNEHGCVQVLAVLPGAESVTIITESGGVLGCFSCPGEDGYRTCGGGAGHDCTAAVREFIDRWHRERGVSCCGDGGPYCCASIAYAYEQLRVRLCPPGGVR